MITGDLHRLGPGDLAVATLGECRHSSPMAEALGTRRSSVHWVDETDRVLLDDTLSMAGSRTGELPAFEPAGPRSQLFFDPAGVRAGIVTCGGLCPGLNNVVRGLVIELLDRYGVREVVGFTDGYRGLTAEGAAAAMPLTVRSVEGIQAAGGTILGTTRGAQAPDEMLDTLVARGISMLFVVGGDGSLRGAQGIVEAAAARGVDLAVVGVPKTIDNDIPFLDHSFGFQTAFARAAESIRSASTEATSTPHGVGLVKLMGRHSGFIACYAALAHHAVDFVVIPEVHCPWEGEAGLIAAVRRRVESAGSAVVVIAEGAAQDPEASQGRDASGNPRLTDVGPRLRDAITGHFADAGVELTLRYVDPGYAIRSVPANAYDAVYCLRLAQAAVHAAMSGRTAMMVGRWHGRFVHIPIPLATASRNLVDPDGDLWMAVLEATGQPGSWGGGS